MGWFDWAKPQVKEYVFEYTWIDQIRDAQLQISQAKALEQIKQVSQSSRGVREKMESFEIIETLAVNSLPYSQMERVKDELMIASERALARAGLLDTDKVEQWVKDWRAYRERTR